MNELKLRARSTVPEKPSILADYEVMIALHIPFVEGGLIDQPHLSLLEFQTVHQMVQLMGALNKPPEGKNAST